MLGGERGEGWPDSPRLVANITLPLGATNATALIFLLLFLPSPHLPALSFCRTCRPFTRLSVCLDPCPTICVCWPLRWPVFFSLLAGHRHCFASSPCLLSSREPSCIYAPVLMGPLSAVLVLLLSSTSLSFVPFLLAVVILIHDTFSFFSFNHSQF